MLDVEVSILNQKMIFQAHVTKIKIKILSEAQLFSPVG